MKLTYAQIQDLSIDLIRQNGANLAMMQAMDDMDQMQWSLPPQMRGTWIRKSISSDPRDSLNDGTNLFDSLFPKIRTKPLGPKKEDSDKSEKIERGLAESLRKALSRKSELRSELIKDAMKYARVACQVVYLPHQEKVSGIFEDNPKMKKHVMRFGDFAIIRRNPASVFPIRDDWLTKAVLYRSVMTIQEIEGFWGKAAKNIIDKANEDGLEYATIYDYWSYEQRMVWASPQEYATTLQPPDSGDSFVFLDEENDLDFMPWIVVDRGKPLQPLLYSVYKGGQYDDMNILNTLSISEVIAYTAAPRGIIEGPNGELVEVDYGEPGRNVIVPPGHKYTPIDPPKMDASLLQMYNTIQARVNKSTISSVVQGGDIKSGTAFASLQKLVELGIKALNPFKKLAESAVEEILYVFLHWLEWDGKSIVGDFQDTEGVVEQINVPIDFNVYDLAISVELAADMPIDEVARMNAAVQGLQIGNSQYTSMNAAGTEDPQSEIDRAKEEQKAGVVHQIELENLQRANNREQMVADGAAQGMAQAAAQQAMQGGQQPEQTGQPPTMAEQMRDPQTQNRAAQNRGAVGPGGEGFNPAAGGSPPALAAPEDNALSNQARQ